MPKLLAILAVCLIALSATAAAAQQTRPAPPAGEEGRVDALLAHGNDAGQYLAVVSRVIKSDGTLQPTTDLRYRPVGAGLDAWVRYAGLDARVLALAERAGDLAVLVEVAQSGPERTQLRYLYNPLTPGRGAQDVPGPRLPAGQTAVGLAGGAGETPLLALVRDDAGDAAAVWAMAGDEWQPLAALPDGVAGLPDAALSLGVAANRPVVVARVGPTTLRVLRLPAEAATRPATAPADDPADAWQTAGEVQTQGEEAFLALDAAGAREPLLYLFGQGDRVVRLGDNGEPESVSIDFALPEESPAVLGAADPRAATLAMGAVRLDRAADRTDAGESSAFTARTPPQLLLELALDAATLRPAGDGRAAPLSLASATPEQVRHDVLMLLLYALLIVAVVTVLRQKPLPSAEKLRDVAGHLAPPALRLAAGLVDALPLVITLGFWYVAKDRLAEAAVWVVIGVGVTVYFGHLIAAELATGRSVGKAMFGLKVVRTDGGAAGTWAILLRNLLRPLDAATGGLTLALALLTPLRQRLGDMAAATTVVQTKREEGDDEPEATDD